jgi:DNA topoisomerase-1
LSPRTRRKVLILPLDPIESARVSGLRYVSDRAPGILRKRAGSGFKYVRPDGVILKDPEELRRIRALVIPPAWTDVWICALPHGHLQAVGRDAKGRKQYRYHAMYRQVRNQTKFSRMIAFGAVLPTIRKRVDADLQGSELTRTKVLATLVKLLEYTCMRIGNEEYVQENESFGLTTLRNRHVTIGERTLRFRFKGKSGQTHDLKLTDRKLARIVAECQSLPGQELFQYIDDDGQPAPIHSDDVNAYLREITSDDFTAKDFRTWIGTTEAVLVLEKMGRAETAADAKKNTTEAVKQVAQKLGNRPATCRTYYIHPAILESYAAGTFFDTVAKARAGALKREENAALAIIENAERDARTLIPKLKQSLAG